MANKERVDLDDKWRSVAEVLKHILVMPVSMYLVILKHFHDFPIEYLQKNNKNTNLYLFNNNKIS